jgi:heat-inducible transcriptional repressor
MHGDDRRLRILETVVRLYSANGLPVSSGLVARALDGDVSSATVRAEMARLELDGLLTKPHHSAGRAPTDTGFRVFVNQLLQAGPAAAGATALAPLVERELDRTVGAPAMVKALAALLCRLTDSIGIIMGPTWDGVRARRLDLYRKEGRRVLMVLTLDNALVRTGTFVIDREASPEVLDAAARILSERVHGKTVAQIRAGALEGLPDGDSPATRVAGDLARQGDELFADVEESELELMGVANVLDEPEFEEPARLKKLVRFLESPREIRSALRRLSPENDEGIAVWIGSENPIDELRPFSLVSSAFPFDGKSGVLAVLGLRRMPYDRAIHGLQTLVESLKQLP